VKCICGRWLGLAFKREGEVEIAKKLKRARARLCGLSSLSISIKEVLNIGDKLLTGEIRSRV